MKTSENGIALIKSNEGFAAHVYADNGHEAIGYGHDLQVGEDFSEGITPERADALLRKDLAERFEPAVNAAVPADCTQNQFDALVDFAYNLGIAAVGTMAAHGWDEVPAQILRWNHVNGQVNAGLTARRQAEADLFVA